MTDYPGFAKAREQFEESPLCRACGGSDRVNINSLMGVICSPCFYIWYDGPLQGEDATDPEKIGELSRKAKAEGKWPWDKPERRIFLS